MKYRQIAKISSSLQPLVIGFQDAASSTDENVMNLIKILGIKFSKDFQL